MTCLRSTLAAAALVSLSGALPALAQTLPPGPPVAVQIVTQPGPAMPQFTRVDVPLLREGLAAKSGGRINVTLASWPERNLNGPEIIRLVRAGQVDIGAVPLNTVAGDVPLLDVVDLAGLNPSLDQARRVAAAMLPEVNKELERFGVKILAMYPFAAQEFFCRGEVKSLADLRGKRIRTGGGSSNDFVSSIGGQPTGIGFPEVYAALERGVVDCAITGTGSGNSARWYEVTQSLYALPLFWSVSAYVVNIAWWNRLDPAVRTMMEATLKEVEEAQWKLGLEQTEDGIACNTGNREGCKLGRVPDARPMSVFRPVPADTEVMRTTLRTTILPAWVKRCGARCGEIYNRVVAPITGVQFTAAN
ncbi:TRAP transporter substrate-binding protein [Phreatobacter aquaticus]|uniref:TRAP transporter substrate-binding protein n=1 Tax=Phreatobacter aquaticus TaxID=2570229 RepID=A0A4D7QHZ9_9HYPH|nr:TRAP transporter substrate-binding protein [Phreatobacter aquaticus]QCK85439.1 TRAP transporter substrate-binding protein [Phreatobacter aquaticus]